jgi:peptidoglycan/LPS O-acetylase OafA/YrhL
MLKLTRFSVRWPLLGLIALSCAIIASGGRGTGFNLVYALTVPLIVLGLAHGRSSRLASYNRLGDYSYGTYLLAFPIQQALMASFPALTPTGLTAAALPCTVFAAVLLWHGVESPAMNRHKPALPVVPAALLAPFVPLAPRDQLAKDLAIDPVA